MHTHHVEGKHTLAQPTAHRPLRAGCLVSTALRSFTAAVPAEVCAHRGAASAGAALVTPQQLLLLLL
jgi:hypothetical protein